MDYAIETTGASLAADIAAAAPIGTATGPTAPAELQQAATLAAQAAGIADTDDVDAAVAFSTDGRWAVVRVAKVIKPGV